MELPPYHKPDFRNILYVTFQRTFDIFCRALRVISIVSIVFFALTYGFGGNAESSILYRFGKVIEPVTMFFGLKWQAFLAFCASAISKESLPGVLNTLYDTGGSLVSSSALAATARETHSVKWTAKIGAFYTVAALSVSCIVYHIGLLIF